MDELMSRFVVTPQFITPKELVFDIVDANIVDGGYNDINSMGLLARYSKFMPCYRTLSSGFHILSSYDCRNWIEYVFCSLCGGGIATRKLYQLYSLHGVYYLYITSSHCTVWRVMSQSVGMKATVM